MEPREEQLQGYALWEHINREWERENPKVAQQQDTRDKTAMHEKPESNKNDAAGPMSVQDSVRGCEKQQQGYAEWERMNREWEREIAEQQDKLVVHEQAESNKDDTPGSMSAQDSVREPNNVGNSTVDANTAILATVPAEAFQHHAPSSSSYTSSDDYNPWPRPNPSELPNEFYDEIGTMTKDVFALERPKTEPNRFYATDSRGRLVAVSPDGDVILECECKPFGWPPRPDSREVYELLSSPKRRALFGEKRSYEELAACFSHMKDYLQIEEMVKDSVPRWALQQRGRRLRPFKEHPRPWEFGPNDLIYTGVGDQSMSGQRQLDHSSSGHAYDAIYRQQLRYFPCALGANGPLNFSMAQPAMPGADDLPFRVLRPGDTSTLQQNVSGRGRRNATQFDRGNGCGGRFSGSSRQENSAAPSGLHGHQTQQSARPTMRGGRRREPQWPQITRASNGLRTRADLAKLFSSETSAASSDADAYTPAFTPDEYGDEETANAQDESSPNMGGRFETNNIRELWPAGSGMPWESRK